MKQQRKLTSFVLVLALMISSLAAIPTKAATTVTVNLRIEKDASTVLPPVSVTMTDADLSNDFGIGLTTGEDATFSPLRAVAKYLSEVKNVSNADMPNYIIASSSSYGLYVTGISITGEENSGNAGVDAEVYWMYAVNNENGSVAMSDYPCKNNDSIVIYGLWSPYSATGDAPETLRTAFDKAEYTTTENTAISLTLTGYGEDWSTGSSVPYTKPIAEATVTATSSTGATTEAKTNSNGIATFTFAKAGDYTMTASRKAADGTHYDISRPYAVVHVTETKNNTNTTVTNTDTTNSDTSAVTTNTTKKTFAKVTIVVKKGKKAVKKVTLKKKKSTTLKVSVNSKGKLSLEKLSKKAKKIIRITLKNGKLTIKGKKKGTVKLKIKAASTSNYKAATKTITIKVK